ncbi:MAG: response regulator transcription factor [Oxalobacteraceae bacterium]|nr:MAG: response regulator transcription factor [Oxalobacteraceae bacterium]
MNTPMPISVAIIEDDAVVLNHLVAIIDADPEFVLVGTASNGKTGRELIQTVDAEIYLLDLGLPDFSGLALLPEITRQRPLSNAMVITMFDDDKHVIAAIESGANGYLLKDADTRHVSDALRELHNGGSPLSPIIAKKLLTLFRGSRVGDVAAAASEATEQVSLTERETEVLQQLSTGLSFREIADVLAISSHTVAQHVRNIYKKLAVRSRGKAVYEATRLGLLQN